MKKLKGLLLIPVVLVMLPLASFFGFHFCAEEAFILVGGAASVPFIGPWLKAKFHKHKE